jgi:hypothetical protein
MLAPNRHSDKGEARERTQLLAVHVRRVDSPRRLIEFDSIAGSAARPDGVRGRRSRVPGVGKGPLRSAAVPRPRWSSTDRRPMT